MHSLMSFTIAELLLKMPILIKVLMELAKQQDNYTILLPHILMFPKETALFFLVPLTNNLYQLGLMLNLGNFTVEVSSVIVVTNSIMVSWPSDMMNPKTTLLRTPGDQVGEKMATSPWLLRTLVVSATVPHILVDQKYENNFKIYIYKKANIQFSLKAL